MKKTICCEVMTFDELSDEAKEKARDWYRGGALNHEWYEPVFEGAKTVGLEIIGFDIGRQSVEAKFMESAEETAHKIETEHGEATDTFKDAKNYLRQRDEMIDTAEKDENGLNYKLDALDEDFLNTLKEDFLIILREEMEYLLSDESIDDTILSNEYTFTVDGKRKGE